MYVRLCCDDLLFGCSYVLIGMSSGSVSKKPRPGSPTRTQQRRLCRSTLVMRLATNQRTVRDAQLAMEDHRGAAADHALTARNPLKKARASSESGMIERSVAPTKSTWKLSFCSALFRP